MLAQSEVVGPQVNLPGSQQLAPVFFGLCTFVLLVALAISLFVRHRRSPKGQRPVPVVSIVIAVLVTTIVRLPPSFSSPEFPPLERLFPDDAVFYRTATDLPVSADSDRWLAAMGDTPLLAGFGDQPVDGIVFGIPFNPVTPQDPMTDVRIDAELVHANEAILKRPEVQDVGPVHLLPTGIGRACCGAFGCPAKHIREVAGVLLQAPDHGDQLDVFLRGTGRAGRDDGGERYGDARGDPDGRHDSLLRAR